MRITGLDALMHDGEGYVDVLDGPSLGITVDEETVRERAVEDPQWERPGWRHANGRIAQS